MNDLAAGFRHFGAQFPCNQYSIPYDDELNKENVTPASRYLLCSMPQFQVFRPLKSGFPRFTSLFLIHNIGTATSATHGSIPNSAGERRLPHVFLNCDI
jgi:hypothetical protein